MAVEFYEMSEKGTNKFLFTLDSQDFESMKNTLSVFKKKTGLNIDEYGTTRISQGHIRLIMNLIELQLKGASSNEFKSLERLLKILEKLKWVKNDLLAIGD